jgi:hypothetical protein
MVAGSIGPLPPVDGEPLEKRGPVPSSKRSSPLLSTTVSISSFRNLHRSRSARERGQARAIHDRSADCCQMAVETGGRLPEARTSDFSPMPFSKPEPMSSVRTAVRCPRREDAARRLLTYGVPVSAYIMPIRGTYRGPDALCRAGGLSGFDSG